jgi:hypothetical protein
MKFSAQNLIENVSLADYEVLYFDEAFGQALCREVKLARHLVSREQVGQCLKRAVRVGPEREIPAPVAKILGASRIEYTEHIEYTVGAFAGRWHTVSSLLTDKVHSSGTFKFLAQGRDVMRVVDGDISVKVFGLGGLIERYIAADVERSYAQAADFTNRYLREKAGQGQT